DAARLIAEAAPDDADQRSAAVISLVQTDIFNVLLMLQEAETANPEERLLLMGKAAKGIADLSRASLSQKKHEQDIRRQVAAEAAEKVEKIAKRGGMSRETVEAIKAEILGVARA
ncbi:phage protein Gp27 family protein, partial [Methylogaea oryzae]